MGVASTVFFLMESMSVGKHWKTWVNVGALVTLIAGVHYFYMREYWVQLQASPIVYRYIDWSLTVPLQMIEFYLILQAVKPDLGSGMFFRLLIGTVVMLLFGYMGQEIDFDTAIVPKGAYALNEAHQVVPSSDFKGLGLTEAKALASYVHFRPPTSVASLRALARTDVQFYKNFLDPVTDDLPKGCWACRQDPSASLVTLRSLMWTGYCSYHIPGSTKFGGLYFGYGQKNRDLPFIL